MPVKNSYTPHLLSSQLGEFAAAKHATRRAVAVAKRTAPDALARVGVLLLAGSADVCRRKVGAPPRHRARLVEQLRAARHPPSALHDRLEANGAALFFLLRLTAARIAELVMALAVITASTAWPSFIGMRTNQRCRLWPLC